MTTPKTNQSSTNLTERLVSEFFSRSDMPAIPRENVRLVISAIEPLIVSKREGEEQVAAVVEEISSHKPISNFIEPMECSCGWSASGTIDEGGEWLGHIKHLKPNAAEILANRDERMQLKGFKKGSEVPNRCANCGRALLNYESCIVGDACYDGEAVCSTFCDDELSEKGCPQEHGPNYRDMNYYGELIGGVRQAALEEAAKAQCDKCSRTDEFEPMGTNGWHIDKLDPKIYGHSCQAQGIRALMEKGK